MRSKKAFNLLGEHGLNLIIAVLCIVVLFFLGVALYNLFLGDQGKLAQARAELEEISQRFQVGDLDKAPITYQIVTAKDWWMLNDEFGTMCKGDSVNNKASNFCLCICQKKDCSGSFRTCIGTDKFVVLKKDSIDQRVIQLGKPYTLRISLSKENFYPFSLGKKVTDWYVLASAVSTLFFKFEDGWKWSADLFTWTSVSSLVANGGVFRGETPTSENVKFINDLNSLPKDSNSKASGEAMLTIRGAHLSEGSYIIDF